MDDYIPVISDPYYAKSTWFEKIMKGIVQSSKNSREKLPVKVFSAAAEEAELDNMPDVVIVTNGLYEYVRTTVNALLRTGRQVVLSGSEADHFGGSVSYAYTNYSLDMENMITYLIMHGKKRISLVGFRSGAINDMAFYHSAVNAAEKFGVAINDDSTFFWTDKLENTLDKFIKVAGNFDAAVCPNDTTAICLVNICKTAGITIPDDLFITGVCDMIISRYCDPSLTTIQVDFERIGAETYSAWEFIRARKDAHPLVKVLIPGKIIARASTAYAEVPALRNTPVLTEFPDNKSSLGQFFADPLIYSMIRIENCLNNGDELDKKIIFGMMQGKSYEKLSEELFISISTISYRRRKIFRDADVNTRAAFELLMHSNIGKMSKESLENIYL